jgi:hypothetical protein
MSIKKRRANPHASSAVIPDTNTSTHKPQTRPLAQPQLPVIPVFITLVSVVFGVYASTAYPTVSGGDTGELIVSACQLSVAHPPGYPTFTLSNALVINAARFMGFNFKPAYLTNLLSAFQSALAAGVIFLSVVEITADVFSAAAAAFIMAFSPTVWLYSIQSEVFPLNNLIISSLIFMSIKYFWAPDSRQGFKWVCLGSLVCGLAATNQHTAVFFILPLVLLVLSETDAMWMNRIFDVVKILVCFLLGLLPYVHLPLATYRDAKESWGNHSTVRGFLMHFLRTEYGTFQLAASETGTQDSQILQKLGLYFWNLSAESYFLALPLTIIGFVSLFRYCIVNNNFRRLLGASVLFLGWAFYVIVFHYLSNLDLRPLFLGVQMRFWQQPNLIIFVLCGKGISTAINFLPLRPIARFTFSLAICLFALLFPLQFRYSSLDHSQDNIFELYAKSVLDHVPKNSLVLLNGDISHNTFKYLQSCEGSRTDVDLVSLQLMSWPWFSHHRHHYPRVVFPNAHYNPYLQNGFSLKQLLDSNWHRPIFLCGNFKEGDNSHEVEYTTLPFGYCNRIIKKTQLTAKKTLSRILISSVSAGVSLNDTINFDEARFQPESWERVAFSDFFSAQFHLFIRLAELVGEKQTELNQLTPKSLTGKSELMKLLNGSRISADNLMSYYIANEAKPLPFVVEQPEILMNVGVVYGLYSRFDGNYSEKMFDAWQMFLDKRENPGLKEIVEQGVNPYL